MSSTYRAICTAHVPALVLDRYETSSPGEMIARVRDGAIDPEHKGCKLLVGRWSGSLIELACPHHTGSPEWIDDAFLRLAAAVSGYVLGTSPVPTRAAMRAALADLPACWSPARLTSPAGMFALEGGIGDLDD